MSKSSNTALYRNVVAGVLTAMTILAAETGHAADLAASSAQPAPAVEHDWKLIISPYVWGTSLNGNASVLGVSADVDVPFSQALKNLDFAIMGSVELTNGIFGGYINGQYTDVGTSRDVYAIDIKAGMTSTILSGGVFYRLFEVPLGGHTVFGTPRSFAIEPTVGVRWTQLTADIKSAGHELSAKESWTDIFAGTRVSVDLTERWNLFAEGDVGGFDPGSQFSLNGQAYIGYRTTMFGYDSIIRAGYRALHQEYEANGFKWDVTQHGPVVGVSMQF